MIFFVLFFGFDHIYQVSITLTLAQELIMEWGIIRRIAGIQIFLREESTI